MSDPITCVIADDHPAMLTAVAEVLTKHGIDVVGRASDGQDALETYNAKRTAAIDRYMQADWTVLENSGNKGTKQRPRK